MAQVTVYPTSDAHVTYTDDGKGNITYPRVDGATVNVGGNARGYFRFDLSSYPSIISATLYLCKLDSSVDVAYQLRQVVAEIDPAAGDAQTVWTNANGTQIVAGVAPGGSGVWINHSVTAYAQSHAGGFCDFGMTGGIYLGMSPVMWASKEATNGAQKPYLLIETAAAPDAPTIGSPTWDGTGITIPWTKPGGTITDNHVYRNTTNNSGTASLIAQNLGNVQTYKDTTASPGQQYYYWVKAENSSGLSAFSGSCTTAIISIDTQPTNCIMATDGLLASFTAAASGHTAVKWQWYNGTWVDTVTGWGGETTNTLSQASFPWTYAGQAYRAIYSNSGGSVISNVVRPFITTIGGTSITSNGLQNEIDTCGSLALTLPGIVNLGSGVTLVIDNALFNLSGSGSIKAKEITLRAFKSIDGVTFNCDDRAGGAKIRFAKDAHFNDVAGTALMSNCVLEGDLYFGDDCTHGGTYSRVIPNLSNVVIQDTELNWHIRGAARGIQLIRMFGVVDTHDIWDSDYPLSFGGIEVKVTDCNFEAARQNTVMKLAHHGGSTRRCEVTGCTFTGGHEEQVGCETGITRFIGHVTAKTATSLTLSYDHQLYGPVGLSGTTEHVGCHLLVVTGSGVGNYYEITAMNDAVLTLDTSRFGTDNVSIDDEIIVMQAMADCLWDNNHHILKGGFQDKGNGCNVGISIWGNAVGNTISNNHFSFPEPYTISAMAGEGNAGPSDFAIAINEFCFVNANAYHLNAHNVYENNTIDDNIPVAIFANCYWLDGSSDGASRPIAGNAMGHEYYGQFITVRNNTYNPASLAMVNQCKNMTWTGNTTAPITTYEGYSGSANNNFTLAECPVVKWGDLYAYPTGQSVNPNWQSEPNWLWEYYPTLHTESGVTWVLRDPEDALLTLEGLFSWTDVSDSETAYYVEWSLDGGLTWGDLRSLAANIESESYGSLAGVASLKARVRGYDGSHYTQWIESGTITLVLPLSSSCFNAGLNDFGGFN